VLKIPILPIQKSKEVGESFCMNRIRAATKR
jgi:hypothetical protein